MCVCLICFVVYCLVAVFIVCCLCGVWVVSVCWIVLFGCVCCVGLFECDVGLFILSDCRVISLVVWCGL